MKSNYIAKFVSHRTKKMSVLKS